MFDVFSAGLLHVYSIPEWMLLLHGSGLGQGENRSCPGLARRRGAAACVVPCCYGQVRQLPDVIGKSVFYDGHYVVCVPVNSIVPPASAKYLENA